jgi:hypothetical protein
MFVFFLIFFKKNQKKDEHPKYYFSSKGLRDFIHPPLPVCRTAKVKLPLQIHLHNFFLKKARLSGKPVHLPKINQTVKPHG